ncbi:hypothetical protein JR316_0002048 [Psilocybe cubensis]|uniref:Uncharacterized protein n=2 Tax=Psilocybe cubensis TaxID=181762 RepID=A0ACB8HCD7_PSICU|nr:hypothetical protein JR316_0002048 [Psilocybe cubensis]KAH9485141.1 hypothetical protein JR316_0002048 [Psilocybe cubensis]
MKRQPSRAPSPTPTAFSGISNYRTDSYRPVRDAKGAPAVPTIDYRLVSKTHYGELGRYLANYLASAAPNSRSNARSKLTRLTIQQFHELSTDVYDELVRRKNEQEVPFLPVREEFHPKRNQARQKLATLPTTRFEDLSSDVYFELARRYPEFKEDPSGRGSNASNYDDYPAPDFPSNSAPRNAGGSRTSGRTSTDRDRPSDSGYGGSVSSRRPSQDRRRPSETDFNVGRRSEDAYRRPDDAYAARPPDDGLSAALASRRKPSQDITRRSEDRGRDFGRRPSQATSMTSDSTAMGSTAPSQSTTATSAVIIPNKSTMEEEYIDIPYGREGRESGVTTIDDRERAGDIGRLGNGADTEPDSASDYPSPMSAVTPPAGLGGLSARLQGVEDEDDIGPGNRSGDELYDKYGRSSVDSSRSAGQNVIGSRMMTRMSTSEDTEKMRREYEYKIATMQNQITTLQRDLGDSNEAERKRKESEARVSQLEEELVGFRQRAEEQSTAMRLMQKELEELKEIRQREARQAQEDREELVIFRDRCNKLEEEREHRHGSVDSEGVEQLRSDMEGLLEEINELARRNDELMTAKESDNVLIRDLDNQLKEYKRKYEQAKTELRGIKATSQLFLQAPRFDKGEDQLPMASDGGVQDIHVTAFLSAIDSLLTAGRSNAPTRVLTPMKAVVNAVTNIIEDVKTFERRSAKDRGDVELDTLQSLRDRAEATLSNLVAATKTHASSSGMSPVSLLDAAASHVSVTITEIGRTISIRKATKAEQEQASYNSYAGSSSGGFSPSLRTVDETRSSHQRKASQASSSGRGGRFSESGSPPSQRYMGRRPPSENSSSEQTNSPPPIFDTHSHSGGVVSDDSAQADGSEDAWAELKPYLEAQTESIVYAIQSVLSGVRSPTPSPALNENLTQIITIVSSIVAVCNDNLPPASAQQGKEILKELAEQANTLSEMQALPEVTKESRQIMAKSSFAIANAMKGLMKL